MTDSLITSVTTVLLALVGVAIIAVLVSGRSQTANVLRAGGGAFSNVLGAALSPVNSGSTFTGGVGGISLNLG